MDKWKKIEIPEIVEIKKCVAEFKVSELKYTPWLNFKVKIYENQKGVFSGYTNLMIKDSSGCPFCGVGSGNTIESTLNDTINNFMDMLKERDTLTEDDFEAVDSYDF